MIAGSLARGELAAAEHERETALGLGHMCDVDLADDVDVRASAKANRACGIAEPLTLHDFLVVVEEDVYLVAHTRVHGVGNNAQADVIFDGIIPAIRGGCGMYDFDNGTEGQLIGEIHGARNDDVGI